MKSEVTITKKTVDALITNAKASDKPSFLWDAELRGFGAKATRYGVLLHRAIQAWRPWLSDQARHAG